MMRLVIFFNLFSIILLGQISPSSPVLFPSPDASLLGKYGSFPISKYTGTSSIPIPIYEINFDGLKIPIQLIYNTGGYKTYEDASWVGLGWQLLSTAVIVRSIRDGDDLGQYGYIGQSRLDSDQPSGIRIQNFINGYQKRLSTPYGLDKPDTEADLFTLSLFGKNICFNFIKKSENNGKIGIHLIDYDNLKILYEDDTFRVTDEKGFQYVFKSKEYTSTISAPGSDENCRLCGFIFERNTLRIPTAWYLDQIISPNNKILEFKYKTGYSMGVTHESQEYDDYLCEPNDLASYFPPDLGTKTFSFRNITQMQFLEKISQKDVLLINFSSSEREDILSLSDSKNNLLGIYYFQTRVPGSQKLDSISIMDGNNKLIEKSLFHYSYFNSLKPLTTDYEFKSKNLRLKLDEVIVNDKKYSFNYIEENNIPSKNTYDVDFWGYYNGANNRLKIPKVGVLGCHDILFHPPNDYFGTRLSNFEFAKKGNLNKITYPTGGYTILNYSPQQINAANIKNAQTIKHLTEDINSVGTFNNRISLTPLLKERKIYTFEGIDNTSHINYDFEYSFTCSPVSTIPCDVVYKNIDSKNNKKYAIIDVTDNNRIVQEGYLLSTLYNRDNLSLTFDKLLDKIVAINYNTNISFPVEGGHKYQITMDPLDYPAGGVHSSLSFNYPSSADSNTGLLQDANLDVGGVRLTSTVEYDHNGNKLLTRELDYNDTRGFSTGKLMNEIMHYTKYIDPAGEYYTISSEPQNIIENSANGQHIGYDEVKERVIYENNFSGYTLTKYINIPNSLFKAYKDDNFFELFSSLPNSNKFRNGKVLLEQKFDNNGNLINEKKFDYVDYKQTGNYQYKTYFVSNYVFFKGERIPNTYSLNNVLEYDNVTNINLLKKVTEINYLHNNTISETEDYSYNDKYYLNLKSISFSSDQVLKTTYQYAHEKGNQYLIDKNMVGIPLQTITTKTANGVTKTLSDVETKYPMSQADANTKTSGLPLPYEVDSKTLNNSSVNTELTYDKYDDKGNLLQYSEKGLKPTAIIWGYNQTLPIAKIEGATYAQVQNEIEDIVLESMKDSNPRAYLMTPEQSENNLLNKLDEFRNKTNLSNYQITTYTYDPLIGVTSITSPSGIREIYKYDKANRLEKVVDINGKIIKEYQYNYKQ